MTDTATTRPYGVLGRVLGHSYTPTIYKELAGLEYVRFEREPEDLAAFMTGNEWEGTNVTIPYKRAVMEYLDELSPLAERMGNVNTITRLPDGLGNENVHQIAGAGELCRRVKQRGTGFCLSRTGIDDKQELFHTTVPPGMQAALPAECAKGGV